MMADMDVSQNGGGPEHEKRTVREDLAKRAAVASTCLRAVRAARAAHTVRRLDAVAEDLHHVRDDDDVDQRHDDVRHDEGDVSE
jgi:hypothetical protein